MRRIYRRPRPEPDKGFKANQKINSPVVFLIDENNQSIGDTPLAKALEMAQEAELDLVEVNPKVTPPIVKIIDYGQFKYERDKQAQKQKSRAKKTDTKTVRLSVRIGDHDFQVRLNQAKNFLIKGDKVKVEIRLRGRERQHPEGAAEVINDFRKALEAMPEINLAVEEALTKQGGNFNILLANKKAN